MPVATRKNSKTGNNRFWNRNDKPKMAAEDATKFDVYSSKSAEQILDAIESRKEEGKHEECECEPYDDVFTFNRWLAQGKVVKKGEKAIRIASYVAIKKKDNEREGKTSDDGPHGAYLKPHEMILFCRCQVKDAEQTTK